MTVAIAGIGFAQQEEQAGGNITAITVQEGNISEFVKVDPDGTCADRLSDFEEMDDAEAADEQAIDTGLDGFVCLREALQATGLTDMFTEDSNLTLLAPTDQAFAEYIRGQGMNATDFLADTAKLNEILSYHIITDGQSLADFLEADQDATFTTAQGEDIAFITGVAGGGAALAPEEVSVGAGVVGAAGRADVVGNTVAFTDGYLIPIGGVLLPPAE